MNPFHVGREGADEGQTWEADPQGAGSKEMELLA